MKKCLMLIAISFVITYLLSVVFNIPPLFTILIALGVLSLAWFKIFINAKMHTEKSITKETI